MALDPFLGSISKMEKGPSGVATVGNPVLTEKSFRRRACWSRGTAHMGGSDTRG
ncbi:hypothetical protein ES332_A04G039900v1 [Gossypium tomentosum]|uniref:Uncharacterized protein n=1 Tax=Gossypium tomentosum TaxID=34277 RepID=A0A5D2QXH1_GOSTO|nr:hypothetical protein ES332_A04G039900v1 [Gossypium tomentosum]